MYPRQIHLHLWPTNFLRNNLGHVASVDLKNTNMSGCCPPDSLGALNNSHYTSKGVVEHIDATNIDVYRVGKSEKCIIWNYDIYGFDGGRTRQMADIIADNGNFYS